MSRKHDKPLEECKTERDLVNFVEDHDFGLKSISGGHAVYESNLNGKIVVISTHEKEFQKGLLHKMRKEILAGMGLLTLTFILLIMFIH
jgi:hypothetical protein